MKVTSTAVRGINNFIFYVDTVEKREKEKDKNSKWVPAGFQIRVKGYRMNPYIVENWPTNEDLLHISQKIARNY